MIFNLKTKFVFNGSTILYITKETDTFCYNDLAVESSFQVETNNMCLYTASKQS